MYHDVSRCIAIHRYNAIHRYTCITTPQATWTPNVRMRTHTEGWEPKGREGKNGALLDSALAAAIEGGCRKTKVGVVTFRNGFTG